MARQKLQTGSKTVAIVVHVPKPLKTRIIAAAKAKEMKVSAFLRESLTKSAQKWV